MHIPPLTESRRVRGLGLGRDAVPLGRLVGGSTAEQGLWVALERWCGGAFLAEGLACPRCGVAGLSQGSRPSWAVCSWTRARVLPQRGGG